MFERLYLIRLENPDFEVSLAEAELSQPIMSASFSQREEEAGIVSVQYALQHGVTGTGNRYGVLCGVTTGGDFKVLARGEVVGYPVGLAGAVVTAEIMCRRPDHVRRVDEVWQSLSEFVPQELDNSTDPRRAEMFVPKIVYHDPITLEPRLMAMEGEGAPIDLYGEGASWGQSKILSIRASVTEAPAESVTVGADAVFDERLTLPIDFGPEFGHVMTATPRKFKEAVRKMDANGGGDLVVLEKDVRSIASTSHTYTAKKAFVQPITCIVQKAEIAGAIVETYEIDFKAAVTVTQRRREVAEVKVIPGIWQMGGAAEVAFDVSIYDAEDLAALTRSYQYQTGQFVSIAGQEVAVRGTVSFENVNRSVFVKEDEPANLQVLHALIGQGVREAVQRAHCVQLSLEITGDASENLRVGQRVRVHDARLPGGRACGKVVGVALSWSSSATATLEILCPITDGTVIPEGADVTDLVGAGDGLIRVYGDFSVPEDFSPPRSGAIEALELGDPDPFTGAVTQTMTYNSSVAGAKNQSDEINDISERNGEAPQLNQPRVAANDIDDIEEFLDGTTVSISFRTPPSSSDIDAMTCRYRIGDFVVILPEGVQRG